MNSDDAYKPMNNRLIAKRNQLKQPANFKAISNKALMPLLKGCSRQ